MLSNRYRVKLLLAFLTIYIIWGTTYLAMRFAVDTIPPFTVAGWRFLFAGIVLLVILVIRGETLPTLVQWRSAGLIGCLLMLGGNGLVMWAVQEIPTGVCAVIVATMPLWMTTFDRLLYRGPKIGLWQGIGLFLGLLGTVLLVSPFESSQDQMSFHLPSMIAIIAAPIFWSLGSLHSRVVNLPDNIFMATAAEMICGGLAIIGISIALGEPSQMDWSNVSYQSLLATGYLSIFGSIIALSSYMWLLKNVDASRVSTYTYINPVIAILLGWAVLQEAITLRSSVASLVIVAAVFLIVRQKAKQAKK